MKSFILIHTLSATFVENYGLFTFIFTFAEGWGGDSFYLISGAFGLLSCVVTEKRLN